MDTPPERDFDKAVRLAAELCETPIALISLVDRDRLWFKARYGLEITETHRRSSFCAHSILQALEITEVPEDNGIGIAQEDQHTVFGAFQRLHDKELYPGTGLGLAIVRKGVERMGGRVGLESEVGKGSRFWVELRSPE